MKKLILVLFAVVQMAGMQAQADFMDIINGIDSITNARPGRPGRPDRPNRPNRPNRPGNNNAVQCTYTDDGWEEHSRGHGSCGECLAAHGNCNETCYVEEYACRAIGYDYTGRAYAVVGYGPDRWRAERQADRECFRYGLRNCRIERCEVNQDIVSERSCR